MEKIDKVVHNFKLVEGFSAETSGGILLVINKNDAKSFIQEMQEGGLNAWEIGQVLKSENEVNTAEIIANVEIISI